MPLDADVLGIYPYAHNTMVKAGKLDDAIGQYRQVVTAYPDDAQAKEQLQNAIEARDRSR